MKILGCDIKKAGIPKIEIPVRLAELDEEVIKYYLPQCIAQAERNAVKIKYLKDYVNGSYQPIDEKEYSQKSSGHAQNRIKENLAWQIVQFKLGFLLGEKKQFAIKENVSNDDMTYFDRYLTDVDYYTKDVELHFDKYATGVGTSFVIPRKDIFNDVVNGDERQTTYKTAEEGYDVKVNSPFIYEAVNGENNVVVYSSCIGEAGAKDLFCFNVADVFDRKTKKEERVVTVYTRQKIYEYRRNNGVMALVEVADNYVYGELPMTEHPLNKTRISPIEVVYDLLNALNNLLSVEVNSVEDKVNQLLVFVNCDMEQTDIDTLYQNGIVVLPPAMGGTVNPDVKPIDNDLKYTETTLLTERIFTRLFDIVGVPLASATVSSGNNEAAYLGGGWTNASTVMNHDIVYSEQADREELRKIIKICKLNPDNPINEINANEIDIKYNVNQSNNLLVKTQSMQNLYDMSMPLEDILKAVHLFGDIHNVAQRWQENLDTKKREEEEKAEREFERQSSEQPTGDNLTGQQKSQRAEQTQAEQAKAVS